MAIIDKLLGVDKLKTEIKALQKNISSNQFSYISQQIFPSWQVFKTIETYRIVDDVFSVVNYLSNIAAMIPLYAYDMAGQDLPENNKLVLFLQKLTFKERKELFTYLFLVDECFIYKDSVEFGVNANNPDLHFLHPNFMTIVLSNSFPTRIVGYKYFDTQIGVELNLLPEEVIYIKGFNPTSDFYTKFRGLSKITVLSQTLTRLQAGKDTSVAQLQNGGIPGIVFDKSGDFDRIEKTGTRQDKFARYLKNPANKGAPYFGTGDMGYLKLGLPLADMDALELSKIDFKKICNAYSVSDRLFNNDATGSEISDNNARKSLYTVAIQPYIILVQDALNRDLVPDIKVVGKIEFDFSDIVELQEDMLKKAQALAAAPTMIPNEVQEAMGFDRSEDPAMDMVYIKTGYQLLSDFNPVDPLLP